MKKLSYLIAGLALMLVGCGEKKLTKDEAAALISKQYGYPHVYDYDIFCGDPQHAKNVLEKGLEDKGLVIVHRTLKFGEMATKPIIEFTAKAQPYLLPTPAEDKRHNVQKVKIGEESLLEITSITTDQGSKTATVAYKTKFSKLTPFAVLIPRGVDNPWEYTATLILTDSDGWQVEK